jgi:hypothetical protein
MSDTEGVEMASGQIMIDDDETEEVDERFDLLGKDRKQAKSKPSCRRAVCKAFMIGIAIVVFTGMLIQMWSDYGEYIQTQTFPPRVVSMSSQCPYDYTENCMKKFYKPPDCVWSDGRNLFCTLSKPENHMVDVSPAGDLVSMHWQSELNMTFKVDMKRCVHLTIWSI